MTGVRLIVGCRLDLARFSVAAGLSDRPQGLWAALPPAHARQGARGQGQVPARSGRDVEEWNEGLLAILRHERPVARTRRSILRGCKARLRRPRLLRADAALSAERSRASLRDIADAARLAARADGRHGRRSLSLPDRRMLQDVVTCIRLQDHDRQGGLPEREARRPLPQNARRNGAAVSKRYPEALCAHAWRSPSAARFSLDELTYTYPTEVLEDGLYGAGAAGKARLGRRCRSAIPMACPITSRRSCAMNST